LTRIGPSDLDIFPLCLGANVFGWTADRDESFRILDAFHAGGGDFIDTADSYSAWVPGNTGGDSERIIGEWLAARHPKNVVVATKVSQHPDFRGLSAQNIRAAAEASLKRLGVDTIDLYYAHYDDETVPLEETVAAFGDLVTDGLVRYTAVSNYSAERIREWIGYATAAGSAQPVAVQPHYNLVHRNAVEETIVPVAEEFGLGLVPYYSLASGFLTGKYRSADVPDAAGTSPRAKGAVKYAARNWMKARGQAWKAQALMRQTKFIRNIGTAAHIDHGKTTLSDNLIAGSGMMSEDLAGKQLLLDFDEQEQAVEPASFDLGHVSEFLAANLDALKARFRPLFQL